MPYIFRNQKKRVAGISQFPLPYAQEFKPEGDEEISQFLSIVTNEILINALQESDSSMIRVYEDMLEAMLRKKILTIEDFPAIMQNTITRRRILRETLSYIRHLKNRDDPAGLADQKNQNPTTKQNSES